jgi:putative ATP-dependent endonuclease of OLD family
MEIPGQIIISTHSPYVAAHAEFGDLRHFRKDGAETIVTAIDLSDLQPDDLQKMKWKVLNTRGDMLFANTLVLFEGETEEQAFALFAREYWGRNPNEMGINFIGVGGAGSYLPFLRLATGFGIDWYIFSDAEEKPLINMSAALRKICITDYKSCSNVIVLPEGKNFETYLVDKGYADAIESALNHYHDTDDYVAEFIGKMNNQKMKGDTERNYKKDDDGGRKRALLDIMKDGKTVYAEAIAQKIVAIKEKSRRIPGKIKELFDQIPGVTKKQLDQRRKPHEHSSFTRPAKSC